MNRFIIIIFYLICFALVSKAQTDSIRLDELSITATRTERVLTSVPMPVQFIQQNQIKCLGITRLNNLLSEQAGLVIVPQVNGLGNGIQIQGLNPDYTLILLDGEPLIGRYTGSLDLSRITSANIRKIEIVKGPSSSLYGSEALAGVINIITDQSYLTKLNLSTQYASRNSKDFNILATLNHNNVRASAFIDRYSTNGYDLSPEVFGQTVSPFSNTTFHYKLYYQLHPRHEIQLSYRTFLENQIDQYQVLIASDSIKVHGMGQVEDWNLNASYNYRINSKLKLNTRYYLSSYQTNTDLKKWNSIDSFYYDEFNQRFERLETLLNLKISNRHTSILGIGHIDETIQSTRYGEQSKKYQNTDYAFFQHEWDASKNWIVIAGLRLDNNLTYHMQWSPKCALQFKPNPKTSIQASFGTGFKAPDYRQLYLNFNNSAASYSVFGTEVLLKELNRLNESHQLENIYTSLEHKDKIDAEKSIAINVGISQNWNEHSSFGMNFFRNDLKGLIETELAATTINKRNIYTYSNIQSAYTTGFELNYSNQLNVSNKLSISYQYLIAKDKLIEREVKKGLIYARDPITYISTQLRPSDYYGLSNRSRNQFTIKYSYVIPIIKTSLNARCIYRGKFGLNATTGNVSGISVVPSDINSNGILDRFDHFVQAYALFNLSLTKQLGEHFEIQIGAENLNNYRDPENLPNLIGRNLFIHLQYSFIKS